MDDSSSIGNRFLEVPCDYAIGEKSKRVQYVALPRGVRSDEDVQGIDVERDVLEAQVPLGVEMHESHSESLVYERRVAIFAHARRTDKFGSEFDDDGDRRGVGLRQDQADGQRADGDG